MTAAKEKGFLKAIEEALGYSSKQMASAMGITLRDYLSVQNLRSRQLGEMSHNEAWSGLRQHVAMRLIVMQQIHEGLRERANRELEQNTARRLRIEAGAVH